MDDRVIIVENLTRRFADVVAVNNISFEVRRGEIFGIIGANGAGKTTTIKVLCGLLPPSSGKVRVAGYDVARHPEKVKGRIGYMSQRFSLYQDLKVRENLELFASLYGLGGQRLRERIPLCCNNCVYLNEINTSFY